MFSKWKISRFPDNALDTFLDNYLQKVPVKFLDNFIYNFKEHRDMSFLFDSLLPNKGAWMWQIQNNQKIDSPILQEIF